MQIFGATRSEAGASSQRRFGSGRGARKYNMPVERGVDAAAAGRGPGATST